MAKKKSNRTLTLTEQLSAAIADSGLSIYRIAKDSGVPQATLQRFVSGQRDMRLSNANKVAAYLELHLTKKQ